MIPCRICWLDAIIQNNLGDPANSRGTSSITILELAPKEEHFAFIIVIILKNTMNFFLPKTLFSFPVQ